MPTAKEIPPMFKYSSLFMLFLVGLCSCKVIIKSSEYKLDDGYYHYKKIEREASPVTQKLELTQKTTEKVYINVKNDTLKVYRFKKRNESVSYHLIERIPDIKDRPDQLQYVLTDAYFNIAMLIIPVKFRAAEDGVSPSRLNTNVNAAFFAGYQFDQRLIIFNKTRIKDYDKEQLTYGFNIGVFGGLGASLIDPTVTRNTIDFEYEGFLLNYGLAASYAFQNLQVGLAFGYDYLMDSNSDFWIYQGQPWVGIVLGVKLN